VVRVGAVGGVEGVLLRPRRAAGAAIDPLLGVGADGGDPVARLRDGEGGRGRHPGRVGHVRRVLVVEPAGEGFNARVVGARATERDVARLIVPSATATTPGGRVVHVAVAHDPGDREVAGEEATAGVEVVPHPGLLGRAGVVVRVTTAVPDHHVVVVEVTVRGAGVDEVIRTDGDRVAVRVVAPAAAGRARLRARVTAAVVAGRRIA